MANAITRSKELSSKGNLSFSKLIFPFAASNPVAIKPFFLQASNKSFITCWFLDSIFSIVVFLDDVSEISFSTTFVVVFVVFVILVFSFDFIVFGFRFVFIE